MKRKTEINVIHNHNTTEKERRKREVRNVQTIRERREELGMTQTELAKKVGLTPNMICKLESGAVKPSVDSLIKLAQVLDCTMDRLAGMDG